jgi:hypothetical protein
LECPPLCSSCEGLCEDCDCEDDAEGGQSEGSDSAESGGSSDDSTKTQISTKQKQEVAVTKTATSVGSSVVMIGSMMTGSPDIFVSMFMTVEMLSYLPLINMKLTSHQVDLLVGANQLQDLPDFIPGLECLPPTDSRKNYDFECTNFLRIAQKELLILCSLGLVFFVSSIAACAIQDCLANSSKLMMKVLVLVQKLCMMVLIGSLVKATYAAQHTGFSSLQEVFSWVFIVVVWLLFLLLVGVGFWAAWRESSAYPLLEAFLFNDLQSTRSSRLHFSLLIVHRMSFVLLLLAFDSAKVQLLLISSLTTTVSPIQLSCYLLIVRPFQDIKDTVLKIGSHCVISAFCSFLTLFEFGVLGDDQDLVSTGSMWLTMSIICLHGLGMLGQVTSKVKEIYTTEDQVLVGTI